MSETWPWGIETKRRCGERHQMGQSERSTVPENDLSKGKVSRRGGGRQNLSNKEGFSDCEMISLGTQENKWSWVSRRRWTRRAPASVSQICEPLLCSPRRIFLLSFALVPLCPCFFWVPCFWNSRGVLRVRDPRCVATGLPPEPAASPLREAWLAAREHCQRS